MTTRRTAPLLGLTALLAVWLAGSGCESSLTSPDLDAGATIETARPRGAKAILERYDLLLEATDFVVGVSPAVLNMQAILERYDDEPGVTIKGHYTRAFRGFALHIDSSHVADVLQRMQGDPEVVTIERDVTVRRPQFELKSRKIVSRQLLPWGVFRVGATFSSAVAGDRRGSVSGVEVYVLDSGVDAIGDLNVVDAVNFTKSKTTDDRARHGLPVASILGAKDDAAGLVGVAPGVRIHNYKVLDDNGKTDLSVVINALERVMEHRSADPATPVVVSMSFGADIQSTEYNALDQAVREAVAAGIVVVVAAGNEGVDASTVSPAHAAEAITVGAFDRLSLYASFSNFGPAVDLLAPGVSVEALTSATEYNFLTGTSAAAPHVAGAAALYLSTHPAATPGEVRDALVNAALPLVIGAPDGTTNRALNVASF